MKPKRVPQYATLGTVSNDMLDFPADIFVKQKTHCLVRFILPLLIVICSALYVHASDRFILNINKILPEKIKTHKIFDISELTKIPAVKICSFGPYDELSFVANLVDRRSLQNVNIFPVDEGSGYFVFLGIDGKFLGHDRFPLNSGIVRWGKDKTAGSGYCLGLPKAAIEASRVGDSVFLRMVKR